MCRGFKSLLRYHYKPLFIIYINPFWAERDVSCLAAKLQASYICSLLALLMLS